MKKSMFFPILGTAMLTVVSCSTSRQATVADLTGEWNIVEINDKPVTLSSGQEQPYLGFDTANGHVFGNAGCNSLTGAFDTKAAAGTIDLSGLASTRMMCPDMTIEDNLFKALETVTSYKIASDGNIELCDKSGDAVVTLQKREPLLSAKSLAGTWVIKEIGGEQVVVPEGDACDVSFDLNDNSFSCTTPCNSIMGSFKSDYLDFTFEPSGSTRMMCPDMTIEENLTKVLPTVASFGELADGSIGFYTQGNDLVMVIARQ